MPRKPLGPRSSGAQLWAEVERLRRAGPDEREAELSSELERARSRETALLNELAAARGEASRSGVARDSMAGKPALAKLRSAWDDFSSAILRLPTVRREEGMEAVRLTVAQKLDADAVLFQLDAPRSRSEARERDRLRRLLDNSTFVGLLASDAKGADRLRVLYLESMVRTCLRPSVWKVYEKAADEGLRDSLGTVYK